MLKNLTESSFDYLFEKPKTSELKELDAQCTIKKLLYYYDLPEIKPFSLPGVERKKNIIIQIKKIGEEKTEKFTLEKENDELCIGRDDPENYKESKKNLFLIADESNTMSRKHSILKYIDQKLNIINISKTDAKTSIEFKKKEEVVLEKNEPVYFQFGLNCYFKFEKINEDFIKFEIYKELSDKDILEYSKDIKWKDLDSQSFPMKIGKLNSEIKSFVLGNSLISNEHLEILKEDDNFIIKNICNGEIITTWRRVPNSKTDREYKVKLENETKLWFGDDLSMQFELSWKYGN